MQDDGVGLRQRPAVVEDCGGAWPAGFIARNCAVRLPPTMMSVSIQS
jgi:hypothetical protein